MSIEIMNLRNTKPSQPYDVYIDRRSPLGNPYPMTKPTDFGIGCDRANVCNRYQKWFNTTIQHKRNLVFNQELARLQAIYKKHGKLRLFCWCAPLRCHGLTIKAWLESQ